ncbi:hypothetical protein [Candidatus Nephthysia bennettiae]|uniref:hypothetical protein n=1 Tax=Candidatus Nephthysia bennettiae TaxID=3127016 RepID=UPI0030C6B08A
MSMTVGVLRQDRQIQLVDGQKGSEGTAQRNHDTVFVPSRRECARDGIESTKADRLISRELVEVRAIDHDSHVRMHFFQERALKSENLAARIELIDDGADQSTVKLDRNPD